MAVSLISIYCKKSMTQWRGYETIKVEHFSLLTCVYMSGGGK